VFLLAMLLGALATFNSFAGLILLMFFIRQMISRGIRNIIPAMLLFFLIPVTIGILQFRQTEVLVLSADAVFGVGLATLLFVFIMQKQNELNHALILSTLLIIIYGFCRHFIFQNYINSVNEQAIKELSGILPQMMQSPGSQASIDLIRQILPTGWIVPQVVAMYLGFIILSAATEKKFSWSNFRLPQYYNILILLILPLFLVPSMRLIFVNALISLCILPLIQGIGVLLHLLARYTASGFMLMFLIILIALNLILVALIGFADIWLDFRKLKLKGNFS
jgi:hypothetical protein